MFNKFKISEIRKRKLEHQLNDDRKRFGELPFISEEDDKMSARKAIEEVCEEYDVKGKRRTKECSEIFFVLNGKIKGYLVPIASQEWRKGKGTKKKETWPEGYYKKKTVYMVITRGGIEYLLDKRLVSENDENIEIQHIYTRLQAANHALIEEVCDNWPGEWEIYIP